MSTDEKTPFSVAVTLEQIEPVYAKLAALIHADKIDPLVAYCAMKVLRDDIAKAYDIQACEERSTKDADPSVIN